ncbi:MAG: hypothetical protein V4510_08870 [bacterium]
MDDAPRQGPPGAARFVGFGVLLFLLAILMARLIIYGSWGWAVAAFAAPAVLLVLRFLMGWGAAFVLSGFFVAAVLGLRAILDEPRVSWALLLVLTLFLFSAMLAGRVAVTLWELRKPGPEAEPKPDTDGDLLQGKPE